MNLIFPAILALVLSGVAPRDSFAQSAGQSALAEARKNYQSGSYYDAARYAFSAQEDEPGLAPEAYSWIALSLSRVRMYHAATYFFIRTLQSGNKSAIRRVLTETDEILERVGGDVLRKYLIRHTSYEDYDGMTRSAYLHSLAKDALLKGDEERSIGYVNSISPDSSFFPYSMQLRGTAHAILGKTDAAIKDFQACAKSVSTSSKPEEDLRNRCIAGEARSHYQAGKFADAERAYDRIPKASFVWPDILFEQAWNSFARQEYNRTLGRLVSYKSPALEFVFNSEVDVLTAQSYLALCLYKDANDSINEFNARYVSLGEDIKRMLQNSGNSLGTFHEFGKAALRDTLYTKNKMHLLANRFVRGPYFQQLVASERAIQTELEGVRELDTSGKSKGFGGFVRQVLRWRLATVKSLGGAFVKNSLLDYYSVLISDFEKIAFIKLEMLGRAKEKLLYKRPSLAERTRGNVIPVRRDDQYFWSFNGEFWNDELGDYVFGLESECSS